MSDDNNLLPAADWQTQNRGSDSAEYDIYVTFATQLGWQVKSFEEWLRS